MTSTQAIGVFDSGVGGLSVAKKIREMLPQEDIIYIADSRYAPYGNKPRQFIEQRSRALSGFLLEQHVKAIVVACNTATLSAIQQLRSDFTVPIIGVEPGIKPATLNTRTGVIGVMVTTRTSQTEAFHELVKRYSENVRIEVQACDGLVEQVEQGDLTSNTTRALVERYVRLLLDKGVDTIALGCTHYPYLIPIIKDVAEPGIEIIETGTAVAKQVVRRLSEENRLTSKKTAGSDIFYTTGDVAVVEQIVSYLWGQPEKVLPCQI